LALGLRPTPTPTTTPTPTPFSKKIYFQKRFQKNKLLKIIFEIIKNIY